MKLVYKDNYSEAYETENGARVALVIDNSYRTYYSVFARKQGEKKGKTIATRCTYEKDMSLAKQF